MRRRGVKGILELVLLNKRVSIIDILFHTDKESPLQTKRLRILDNIVLFAAAAVAASGYAMDKRNFRQPSSKSHHWATQPTKCGRRARIVNDSRFTIHDSFGARLLKPMRSWKSSNDKLDWIVSSRTTVPTLRMTRTSRVKLASNQV